MTPFPLALPESELPRFRWAFATVLLGASLAHAPAARAELDPQQVRAAIDMGVKYLKRTQNAIGSWDDYQNHTGGVTALGSGQ